MFFEYLLEGIINITWKEILMMVIGVVLIFLAIKKN